MLKFVFDARILLTMMVELNPALESVMTESGEFASRPPEGEWNSKRAFATVVIRLAPSCLWILVRKHYRFLVE